MNNFDHNNLNATHNYNYKATLLGRLTNQNFLWPVIRAYVQEELRALLFLVSYFNTKKSRFVGEVGHTLSFRLWPFVPYHKQKKKPP